MLIFWPSYTFDFPYSVIFLAMLFICWQHYIKLTELEKNRKLNDLLDALDFNQVVIFVKSVSRAAELNKLLVECNFPSICIHSGMSQEERLGTLLLVNHLSLHVPMFTVLRHLVSCVSCNSCGKPVTPLSFMILLSRHVYSAIWCCY